MYDSFLNEWCASSTLDEIVANKKTTIMVLADEYEISMKRAREAFADWFMRRAFDNLSDFAGMVSS